MKKITKLLLMLAIGGVLPVKLMGVVTTEPATETVELIKLEEATPVEREEEKFDYWIDITEIDESWTRIGICDSSI